MSRGLGDVYKRQDYTVEFAERYQPDLTMDRDTDDFGRPSYTWAWKNRDIGTYVDYSLMVAEYTTGVSGRELYNVLTASTIRNADLILVMRDGNIVEQGTHEELLVKKGYYEQLYHAQFAEV